MHSLPRRSLLAYVLTYQGWQKGPFRRLNPASWDSSHFLDRCPLDYGIAFFDFKDTHHVVHIVDFPAFVAPSGFRLLAAETAVVDGNWKTIPDMPDRDWRRS